MLIDAFSGIILRQKRNMNRNGPVVIIDDDMDDRDFLSAAFADTGRKNKIIFFNDGLSALEYLTSDSDKPFVVISDINMPKLNGFELREMILTNPVVRARLCPYIFLSTAVDPGTIDRSYAMSVQGLFKKPGDYQELVDLLNRIFNYWDKCFTTNS